MTCPSSWPFLHTFPWGLVAHDASVFSLPMPRLLLQHSTTRRASSGLVHYFPLACHSLSVELHFPTEDFSPPLSTSLSCPPFRQATLPCFLMILLVCIWFVNMLLPAYEWHVILSIEQTVPLLMSCFVPWSALKLYSLDLQESLEWRLVVVRITYDA